MKNFLNFFKPAQPVTPDHVLAALSKVLEPEVNRDLVSLNMVHNLTARQGVVSFTVRLREAGTPLQVPIERRAKKAVMGIPGVKAVQVSFETTPRSQLRETSRFQFDTKSVVAVASGKGGVGKTTVAVNLAVALGQMGHRVGLLDGDIHGPNVPHMMGISGEQPFAFGEQIFPPQAHGITIMSMGLLVPAESPVIWRGPMMHQAIRQLLRDVMWGELDYLVVDLPPGTGDVQLTLTQTLPLAGAIMVTTPQNVAFADVLKGGEMFRQLQVPLLGVVENMSHYVCPHCGQIDAVFGKGAGEQLSRQLNTPLLGSVPLDTAVRAAGDVGCPVTLAAPQSPSAKALFEIAEDLVVAIENSQQQPAVRPTLLNPDLPILG